MTDYPIGIDTFYGLLTRRRLRIVTERDENSYGTIIYIGPESWDDAQIMALNDKYLSSIYQTRYIELIEFMLDNGTGL